ncbi:flavin-containing monooxygenase [Nocardia seriolae]|uniref:flavin-containing monooxygenase n=1 Tax=Nocardia seriolae TaxID=37332 RepID=UPI00051A2AA9|nr:NAD(P)/FAD-dependent oxidoreductase [Nocardia seriolae]MTJ65161.1 NAD(P)-binding protein [Nocardia seriolae]MTJ71259.1 NAD(P)-binding protein [Nocardia seriolae]MTJ86915.1 NAD(P)-binding protein [Nocardia seriolae]MTK30910.1 NAD(P)-binding protein [Nocardia seriolae]MTK43115.1 NAD(P)-binding protein [Nocardia seriolae]
MHPAQGSPFDVIIIGAGFAGLHGVHQAARAGLNVLGLEAGDDVGGTWYWNRYPGARCDVESVDYSYSFDEELQQSWTWTERFAAQPEILAYMRHVADRFDLKRHYRFGQRVTGARFDEAAAEWTLSTESGAEFRSQFVVFATGCLSAPIKPNLPGIETFAGEELFTAQWPEQGVSFEGKRVGVIGTGSSGIQVSPIIAREAQALTVFQRSANFSVPVPNRPWTEQEQGEIRATYRERRENSYYAPAATPHRSLETKALELTAAEREQAMEDRWNGGGVLFNKVFPDQNSDQAANELVREFAVAKIRAKVDDPAVADDLVPYDHPIGTKRICTDSGYYEMFNRPNVELVNLRREAIVEVTPTGIRTADRFIELDTLVYATGFDAMTGALLRIDLHGAADARLGDTWVDGPVTYLGFGIPGFPNLFSANSVGTPSVMANMVLHSEQQLDWVLTLIQHCRAKGIRTVAAREDAAVKWTDHLLEVAEGTLFIKANSWYMGANIEGKKRVFMPYIGGFGNYRRYCDEERDNGYPNFELSA